MTTPLSSTMPLPIDFQAFPKTLPSGSAHSLVVFTTDLLDFGGAASALLGAQGILFVKGALEQAKFKAKPNAMLDVFVPLPDDRAPVHVVVVGLGGEKDAATFDWLKLGGTVMGKLAQKSEATVVWDFAGHDAGNPKILAEFAEGVALRAYKFDRYKTKKSKSKDKEGDAAGDDADDAHDGAKLAALCVYCANPTQAETAYASRACVVAGTLLARDLVNEPPNVLYPESFAAKAKELEALGVEVEIIGERRLSELGFGALLAVGQGSVRESHVVIMYWNGADDKDKAPLAIIGKGVCFDTGGISIKPAASMEDMKGDMAGAACVVGLMHALAARKAKANVVGAIGLVENMPDGKSYRPGDIITSLSGQTIEVINTDAEGRLVLADVLWHVKETVKPVAMVDLATLTGAILVALGQEYAGLYSNNDALSEKLIAAGKKTGEKLWRMPLDKAFNKMIDSKFADMKNTGGRFAGSSTAAHFLQRYVDDTPWAHLDIAGTAMAVTKSEINNSWASGFGVRLLDSLVQEFYEG